MTWTVQQERAINQSGNIIVSAAAGSGKTAVLTERIVRLICEGADVTEFLCVTFTNAASGEMKKRIEKRLYEAAADAAETDAERLYDAAANAARANISTLHSFCAQVLRRHFNRAGLDAAFRIADDAEALALKYDAMDEFLEERYSERGEAFTALVDALGGEDRACEAIYSLYEFTCAQVDAKGFWESSLLRYTDDARRSEAAASAGELIASSLREQLGEALSAYVGAYETYALQHPATEGGKPTEFAKAIALMESEIARAENAANAKSYDDYARALAEQSFDRLTFSKKSDEDAKADVQDARNELKDVIKKQVGKFTLTLAEEKDKLKAQAPLIAELCDCTDAFSRAFFDAKSKKGVIDYNDMEHMTLSLFTADERVRNEYRDKFKYIFVDEYQDTNAVQEAIVQAISREDSVFTVGDVKQSIYRFRQAEPELFLSRYDAYRRGHGGEAIDLNANFRSAGRVIDAVNGIFSRIMKKDAAEIEYDAAAALVKGRTKGDGACEFHLIPYDSASASGTAAMYTAELEAEAASRRIIHLIENETLYDSAADETRPYRYSDFAVLLRSHKGTAAVWTEVLSRNGIPSYAETTGGFFDATEVRTFMDVLRVIDNNRQDIPLLTLMRSPMGGFSADELAAMRSDAPDGTLYDSLKACAGGTGAMREKAAALLSKLSRWRRESRLFGVEEFLHWLLDETGYSEFTSALPGGRERQANLFAFVEHARVFEKNGVRGLHGFIRYMDRLVDTNKLGTAQIATANVVRVLSVHRSKGLEFNVVILGALDRDFNESDQRDSVTADASFGIGMRAVRDSVRRDTLLRRAINVRAGEKSLAEEMRVLYVALTRARERLIMLCATRYAAKRLASAQKPLTVPRIRLASRMSDWLLPVILQSADGAGILTAAKLTYSGIPLPGMGIEADIMSIAGAGSLSSRLAREDFALFRATSAVVDTSDLDADFSWSYPHAADTLVPSKVTVTGLSGHETDICEYPEALTETQVGATQSGAMLVGATQVGATPVGATSIGTAAHALMQRIRLCPHTRESVSRELDALVSAGLVDAVPAGLVNTERIAAFFSSPLGQRLITAQSVMRELEFTYRIPARRLTQCDSDEFMLLQGVIDCCFIEDGEWVIIDYKTDRVPNGMTPRDIAARHTQQLALYAEALCALTKRPVRERYIFLLSVGEAVEL